MSRITGVSRRAATAPIDLDPSIDPWDPQPTETPRSYGYFHAFLMMGPERRFEKLMRSDVVVPLLPNNRKGRDKPEDNPGLDTILQWSKVYRWQERLLAWAGYQARINREQLLQRQKEMLEAHYNLVLDMQDILANQVGKWVKKVRSIDDMTVMSIEEMRKMAETVFKLGRLSLGMSDSISEEKSVESTEQKIESLSREQRVKLLDEMMAGEGPMEGVDVEMMRPPSVPVTSNGNGASKDLDYSGDQEEW